MNESASVCRPGSLVGVGGTGIEDARVLRATIHDGGRVTYDVAWWANGARVTATLEAFEVEAVRATKTDTVGFIGGGG